MMKIISNGKIADVIVTTIRNGGSLNQPGMGGKQPNAQAY